jgi:phosphatidate cytidylyltransferase
MALNLKTLATRSMSAAVFVVLLIGCVYWNYISFSVFFFAVSMIGLSEFYNIAEKLNSKPYRILGLMFGGALYLVSLNINLLFALNLKSFPDNVLVRVIPFLVLAFFALLAVPVFKKNDNSIRDVSFTLFGILYAVVPFITLNLLVSNNGYDPKLVLGIIFLIWSSDTFAYLGGSIFGKNKMIERISPGKTWEGTIIGVIITFGVSFLIKEFYIGDEGYFWPMLGLLVPVLATIGDLVESMLKRQAGVKDSGKIMPGHGGVLDRFDSLIFVAPLIYVAVTLVSICKDLIL